MMGEAVNTRYIGKYLLTVVTLLLNLLSPIQCLRFAHSPVTAEHDLLIIGQPTRLTCNYVKYRTETVRQITWYLGYEGFQTKIFRFEPSTGEREGSRMLGVVETDDEGATETQLTITLPDFRSPKLTFGCEVEVLRDNGYGKVKHAKKLGEATIRAVDTTNHILMLKKGSFKTSMGALQQSHQHTAAVGESLLVSCISLGLNPPPDLFLSIKGQPLQEMPGGRVQLEEYDEAREELILTGYLDTIHLEHFDEKKVLLVECSAKVEEFPLNKKELALRQHHSSTVQEATYAAAHSPRRNLTPLSRRDHIIGDRRTDNVGYESPYGRDRSGKDALDSSGYYYEDEANIVHNRMLDMIDPKRHRHPGIPYDFHDSYILLTVNTARSHATAVSVMSKHSIILGELPPGVKREIYSHSRQESDYEIHVKMHPIHLLNLLGNHGYRVVGSSGLHDGKDMVWTLERKNFDLNSWGKEN